MFKCTFKTGNAAFCDDYTGEKDKFTCGYESARILKGIVKKIEDGYTSGKCVDICGNTVGEWSLE